MLAFLKSSTEAATGYDYIAGRDVEGIHRALSCVSAVLNGYVVVRAGKVILQNGSQGFSVLMRGSNEVPATNEFVDQATTAMWDMPESGKIINGRWFTKHALERMAPNTPEIRAELATRATKLGYTYGSPKFVDYVKPRFIPPSVVENTIQTGVKSLGEKPGTWNYVANGVEVIINDMGNVITVIPQ